LFSISHSFLSGQHHLLIFLGLVLGSEKLALGFIFLGGVLTALSLACLSSRGASGFFSTAITLLFLLTPVIFWQITSPGAPDIWMAFFANTFVLVSCQTKARSTWRHALLAGLLAGGIAGAKYTGCVMAAGLAICVAIEFRSVVTTGLFCAGSLITGVWPWLRNLLWTGDPVFPFLLKRLFPERINTYGLANLLADTGATQTRRCGELFPFVFFAGMGQGSPGLWDFFGPITLALAPLTLLAIKNVREWRVPVIVWFFSAPVVFFTSGLQRLLLPIFPLALACVSWGIQDAKRREWQLTRSFAIASIVLMWIVGGAGLAVYGCKPISLALGLIDETRYLEERSPDFQIVEPVNHALSSRTNDGKVLVFFRHTYSLRLPFVNGDPGANWAVDPDRLRTPQEWQGFFRREGIGYVVRPPEYPEAIASAFEEMEADGDLLPVEKLVVQGFAGNRFGGERVKMPVVILRVKPDPNPKQGSTLSFAGTRNPASKFSAAGRRAASHNQRTDSGLFTKKVERKLWPVQRSTGPRSNGRTISNPAARHNSSTWRSKNR
jgi:hypothetical protein